MPADETTGAATAGAENEDAEGVAHQLREQIAGLFRLRRMTTSGTTSCDDAVTIRILLGMVEATARRRAGELDEARVSGFTGPEILPLPGTDCPSVAGE